MKRYSAKHKLLANSARLTLLLAGSMAAAGVAADDIDDMVSGLKETLQPAKPIEATSSMVDQAVTVRKSFGLNSDRRYVEALLKNPEAYKAQTGALTGGHYATPDEVETIVIRLVLQEEAIALTPLLHDDPDFAGIFISENNIINIGFTFNADEKVNALRKQVKLPERVRAFSAERTLRELENSKDRIVGFSQELAQKDILISKVAMDVENNTIKIGVVDVDPRKREVLQQLFGDVDIVDQKLNEVEHRADTATVMRAGVRITNSTGGSCTSNWKAQDRTTGELVSITAGHCGTDITGTIGGPGEAFFQGLTGAGAARQIGTVDQTTWTFPSVSPATGARIGSNPVDALRTPYDTGIASMPWLYAYDDANAGVFANGEEVRVGAVDGTVVIGTSVCSGGQFSPANQVGGSNWKNCGTVNAVNVANTFRRTSSSPDRFTALNTNEATYTAIGGDSGAPIWRIGYDAAKGWHGIAVGHHSGGPAGSEIFNDIERVEDELNVDVRFY